MDPLERHQVVGREEGQLHIHHGLVRLRCAAEATLPPRSAMGARLLVPWPSRLSLDHCPARCHGAFVPTSRAVAPVHLDYQCVPRSRRSPSLILSRPWCLQGASYPAALDRATGGRGGSASDRPRSSHGVRCWLLEWSCPTLFATANVSFPGVSCWLRSRSPPCGDSEAGSPSTMPRPWRSYTRRAGVR